MSLRFFLLWLAVTLPLLWGILHTLQNALKLLH
jgi:hypothetical protein